MKAQLDVLLSVNMNTVVSAGGYHLGRIQKGAACFFCYIFKLSGQVDRFLDLLIGIA
jgi:hypothetical protein